MDNLFKALLIIILLAFLYLYFENSGNGRYIQFTVDSRIAVLDTKTGQISIYKKDDNLLIDVIK